MKLIHKQAFFSKMSDSKSICKNGKPHYLIANNNKKCRYKHWMKKEWDSSYNRISKIKPQKSREPNKKKKKPRNKKQK